MPKKIILFFLTAALLSILTGCDGNTASFVDQSSDTTSALQDAFDTSVKAEAYTNELFASMLSKEGISQYEILLTTGGFITSDPLVCIRRSPAAAGAVVNGSSAVTAAAV